MMVPIVQLFDQLVQQPQQMWDLDLEQWVLVQVMIYRWCQSMVAMLYDSHCSIRTWTLFQLRTKRMQLLRRLLPPPLQMDRHDHWAAVNGPMATTIVDATKNANADLTDDDKRIAYHILIDWVHCAVWLKPDRVVQ